MSRAREAIVRIVGQPLTDAIFAALEAEGLVLVPVEPTEEMLKAGAHIRSSYAVWLAMIRAAKEPRHDEH